MILGIICGGIIGFIFGFGYWLNKRNHSRSHNKLTSEEAVNYEQNGYLVLSPAGDTQDFIFGPADHNARCGDAYFGISVDAHKYKDLKNFLGGVIGLEDCIRLRDHLQKHIDAMNQ